MNQYNQSKNKEENMYSPTTNPKEKLLKDSLFINQLKKPYTSNYLEDKRRKLTNEIIFIKNDTVECVIIDYIKIVHQQNRKASLRNEYIAIGVYNNHSFIHKIYDDIFNSPLFYTNKEICFMNYLKKDYEQKQLTSLKSLDTLITQYQLLKEYVSKEEIIKINEHIFKHYPFLEKKTKDSEFSVFKLFEVYFPLLEIVLPSKLSEFKTIFERKMTPINFHFNVDDSLELIPFKNKEKQFKFLFKDMEKKVIPLVKKSINRLLCKNFKYHCFMVNNFSFYFLTNKLYQEIYSNYSYFDYHKSLMIQFENIKINSIYEKRLKPLMKSKKQFMSLVENHIRKNYKQTIKLTLAEILRIHHNLNELLTISNVEDSKKNIVRAIQYNLYEKKLPIKNFGELHDTLTKYYNSLNQTNNLFETKGYAIPSHYLYNMKEVEDSFELKMVGDLMHHCVYTYTKDILKNRVSIVYIKDEESKPIVCIEIDTKNNAIKQIKGAYNENIYDKQLLLLIDDFIQMNQFIYDTYDNHF